MTTEQRHTVVRIVDAGGGLIPLSLLAVVFWGFPAAASVGLRPLALLVAAVLALFSGVLIAERIAQLTDS